MRPQLPETSPGQIKARLAWNAGLTGTGRKPAGAPVVDTCTVDLCGTPAIGRRPPQPGMVQVRAAADGAAAHWYCEGRCAAIARARADLRAAGGGAMTTFPARTLTQEELWAEARERFGENSRDWAFQCPGCLDIATGTEFLQALNEHPREHPRGHDREGRRVDWSDVLGRECIGRILGKGAGRGCQYAAFGFIHGPWQVAIPHTRKPVYSFPLAQARTPDGGDGS